MINSAGLEEQKPTPKQEHGSRGFNGSLRFHVQFRLLALTLLSDAQVRARDALLRAPDAPPAHAANASTLSAVHDLACAYHDMGGVSRRSNDCSNPAPRDSSSDSRDNTGRSNG